MPVAEGLGARIREAREWVGMSQAELARRIGLSKTAMNDIETGDTDPRASRITAIALELDVSADCLLGLSVVGARVHRDKNLIQCIRESENIPERPTARTRATAATEASHPKPPTKRPRRRSAAPVA
jgi:transcriptional regulator with XRE-family HTH domain